MPDRPQAVVTVKPFR